MVAARVRLGARVVFVRVAVTLAVALALSAPRTGAAQVVTADAVLRRAVTAAEAAIYTAQAAPRPGAASARAARAASAEAPARQAIGLAVVQARLGAADLLARLGAAEGAIEAASRATYAQMDAARRGDSTATRITGAQRRFDEMGTVVYQLADASDELTAIVGGKVPRLPPGASVDADVTELEAYLAGATRAAALLDGDVPRVRAFLSGGDAGVSEPGSGLERPFRALAAARAAWGAVRTTHQRSLAVAVAAVALRDRLPSAR